MKAGSILLSLLLASGICSGLSGKTLESGDDLYRAIRKAADADTLYLSEGKYVLDGAVALDKSLTIVGSTSGTTEVEVYLFRIGERMKSVTLKNLDITLTGKYLFDTRSDEGVNADLVCLEDCTVDLGGETGACLVNSRTAGMGVNTIGEIKVSNTLVYNGGVPQHFFFNGGSVSETKVNKFTAVNSTFVNMSRGMIISPAAMETTVDITNCTFYAINRSDNAAGFIRLSNAVADVNITNSVFNFAGESTKFVVTGNKDVTAVNSWFAGDYPSFAASYGVKSLGSAGDVFSHPSEDVADGNTSFRITATIPEGADLGDPRWNK